MNVKDEDEVMNRMNQLRLSANSLPTASKNERPALQSILRSNTSLPPQSQSQSQPQPQSQPQSQPQYSSLTSAKRSRMISFCDSNEANQTEKHRYDRSSNLLHSSNITALRQTHFPHSSAPIESSKLRKRRASQGDEDQQDQDEEIVESFDPQEASSPTPLKRHSKRVRIKSPAPIALTRRSGKKIVAKRSRTPMRPVVFSNDFHRSTSTSSTSVSNPVQHLSSPRSGSKSNPIIKRSRSRSASNSFLFRSAFSSASSKSQTDTSGTRSGLVSQGFEFQFDKKEVENQAEFERLMNRLSVNQ